MPISMRRAFFMPEIGQSCAHFRESVDGFRKRQLHKEAVGTFTEAFNVRKNNKISKMHMLKHIISTTIRNNVVMEIMEWLLREYA